MHQDYNFGIKIEFEESNYDEILLFLQDYGISSLEEGESVANAEGGCEIINEYSLMTLRFASQDELSELKKSLFSSFPEVKITELGKQENYLEEWKKYAKAIQITPNITILPSWLAKPEDYKDLGKIILDAGYAFGTGAHETTTLCAREIEKQDNKNSLLDVGSGSGILSMIAARTGYKSVKGIDIDPLAVETARENTKINCIESIEYSNEDLSKLNEEYTVVVANILSHILISLKNDLIRLLSDNGVLILSGILKEEVETIKKEFNMKVAFEDVLGDWSVLVLIKN